MDCDHLLKQNEFNEWNKSWNFCPACGKDLKKCQRELDKLILKNLGVVSKTLCPTQSIEDACQAFFSANNKENLVFSSKLTPDNYLSFGSNGELFEVGARGLWFSNKRLEIALSKALLWATTELLLKDIEGLFEKVDKVEEGE